MNQQETGEQSRGLYEGFGEQFLVGQTVSKVSASLPVLLEAGEWVLLSAVPPPRPAPSSLLAQAPATGRGR